MNADRILPGFRFLVVLAAAFGLAACHGNAPQSPPDAPRAVPAEIEAYENEQELDGQSSLTDESLYLLDAAWNDQDARPVRLASLRGKPVVLSMIFTRCGWACPTIVRDMKKIAGRLPDEVQDDVRYVLVSMDPDRDTPDVLSGFAREHELDTDRWTLLRGTTEDVRLLAALLGIRYREEANGQFSHTNLITILNREGEVAYVHKGLDSDPSDAGDTLRRLVAETL